MEMPKTFKISEDAEALKQFIVELYKINKETDYRIGFVINSSLLEICDKQFISENDLIKKLRDIKVDVLDIEAGPVKYRINPRNLIDVTFEDKYIMVRMKPDRKFRISLDEKGKTYGIRPINRDKKQGDLTKLV